MSDHETQRMKPLDYGHQYDENDPTDVFSMTLERLLTDAISQRHDYEVRMIADLQVYNGIYDAETQQKLDEKNRSKVFVKLVRAKTNAAEAQLIDLLFPSDDDNWGIEPTPRPDLIDKMTDESPVVVNGVQFKFEDTGETVQQKDLVAREMEVAKEACDLMRDTIDDQLTEASYTSIGRRAIHDACVVGTGIIKGPVVHGRIKRSYQEIRQEDGTTAFKSVIEHEFTPSVELVRPWDFFPDMSASEVVEMDYSFERRHMSPSQVRDLVHSKGFDPDKVRKVLGMSAKQTQHHSSHNVDVRHLAGLSTYINDNRYELWEYHGTIPNEILEAWSEHIDGEFDSEDPLQARRGIVFYCGGVVLGVRLHVVGYELDSPYRVFNWEEDDSSIFGLGVPAVSRDEGQMINSVARMIMDNAAITTGPQVGFKAGQVTPEDGDYALKPFKTWRVNKNVQDIKQAITSFEFNSHLPELQGIYSLARVLLDEVSGVPMLQQGEQGPSTPTLGGMSMLLNAANAVRRRQVRMWDDDVTKPLITDFYRFNMDYHSDNSIKGDYRVMPRGVSSLLVKEQTAQAITNFISVITTSEAFAPALQIKAREILQAWASTQTLPKNIVPSKEELEAFEENIRKQQEEAEANGGGDPALQVEQLRLQQMQMRVEAEAELERAKQEFIREQNNEDRRMKAMQMARDVEKLDAQTRMELMKLANQDKITEKKLAVELEKLDRKLSADMDGKQFEAMLKQQMGNTGNYGIE